MVNLVRTIEKSPEQFEPWFAATLTAHAPELLNQLEKGVHDFAYIPAIMDALPGAYKLYGIPDAAARVTAHRKQAIQKLLDKGLFPLALPLIEQDPDASPELKARVLEGMGEHGKAAEVFRSLDRPKDALRNYRAIPDVGKALALMREMGGEPAAAESLQWLGELQQVLAKRPVNLARVATAAEKKYLAAMLEAQLDGPRVKKPPVKRAPRKTTSTKVAKPVLKRK
jgi:hypothetical protein